MKLIVNKPSEIDAVAIRVVLPVNYGDEDMATDFPNRKGDIWEAVIDIESGKIRMWDGGKKQFFMKVCDAGSYFLLDQKNNPLAAIEGNYVPQCIPGQDGDYVDFKIAEDGTIDKWRDSCYALSLKRSFFESSDD